VAGGTDGAAVERVAGYAPPLPPPPQRLAVQLVASIQATVNLLHFLSHPGITPPRPLPPITTAGLHDIGQDVS
jgi:hypothetical protein